VLQKCEHGPSATTVPRGFVSVLWLFAVGLTQIDAATSQFERESVLKRSVQICFNDPRYPWLTRRASGGL